MGWFTPPQEVQDSYRAKCKLFVEDDEAFKNFKRDPDYGKILEGNEQIVFDIAYRSLREHGGVDFLHEHYERFKENDSIGNPRLSADGLMSPSTMRYVNAAWEIKQLLGDFKPKTIFEIGGGYGGMCKTLSVVYDFDMYMNIDLPEAEYLWVKYLRNFKELMGRIFITYNKGIEYDLFIADSSLAECDPETQLEYAAIAQDCKYVYIVYNTLHVPGMEKAFNDLLRMFEGREIDRQTALGGGVIILRIK